MMPDLFSYAENLPPHRNVDSSIDGARKIKPYVNNLHARILREIGLGATNEQLCNAIGNIKNSTMSGRLRELVLQGKIYASDERRESSSGVKTIVWKLV